MKRLSILPMVFLTQCAPITAPLTPTQHHVVIVGDSVTWASQDALRARIPGIVIDAEGGRNPNYSPSGGPTTMQTIYALIPQIEPGGWLVVQEDACEPIQPIDVMTVAAWLPDDIGLAWVSPDHEGCPAGPLEQSRYEVEHGILAQPVHTFIDWRAVRMSDTAGLTQDLVHPNAAGAIRFADLVAGPVALDARSLLS